MPEEMCVLAGDCTTVFGGPREREQRGDVLVVVKPDGTVLVHDAEGYQPVAWLTRAEHVTVREGTVTAVGGDQCLRVETNEAFGSDRYDVSPAGLPVGSCRCDGSLVRANGTVRCLDCEAGYGLPRDAAVLTDESNCDCGLPRFRVERGRAFEVCLDRDCESLDDRVREAFDRVWDCPHCEGDLRIIRRGGLLAGCEHYPDCDTGFAIPAGTVVDDCDCGLPVFETDNGRRCLDAGCDRWADEHRRDAH